MARDYKKLINNISENSDNIIFKKYIKNKSKDTPSTTYQYVGIINNYIKYISDIKNIQTSDVTIERITDIEYVDIKSFVLENNRRAKSQLVMKFAIIDFYTFCVLDTDGSNEKLNNRLMIIERGIKPKESFEEALENYDDGNENDKITTEELNDLISIIESKKNNNMAIRDLCIACTMFSLGLRCSEVANLNIDDIDFDNNKILIKSEKNIVIAKEHLYPELKIIIKAYIDSEFYEIAEERNKDEKQPLFMASSTGNRIPTGSITSIFKRYGIKNRTSHALRKLGITREYIITGDIYKAWKKARHSSPDMTMKRYITEEVENSIGKYKYMFDGVKIKLLDKYYIQQECLGGKTKDEKEQ